MVNEKKSAMFTKEEELLLQDFNRNVSTGSNMLFYGSAAITTALPICEYRKFDSTSSNDFAIMFAN
jgi:hypothetical protein